MFEKYKAEYIDDLLYSHLYSTPEIQTDEEYTKTVLEEKKEEYKYLKTEDIRSYLKSMSMAEWTELGYVVVHCNTYTHLTTEPKKVKFKLSRRYIREFLSRPVSAFCTFLLGICGVIFSAPVAGSGAVGILPFLLFFACAIVVLTSFARLMIWFGEDY